MTNRLLLAVTLLLGAGVVQTGEAEQVLKGRVLDLESPITNPKGISGVRIAVKLVSGQIIKPGGKPGGATDGEGDYEIRLPDRLPLPLVAEFTKVNYYDYPTTLQVSNLAKHQEPVWMAASKMNIEYYNRVGLNVIGQSDKQLQRAQLEIVAALPAEDQSKVVATLNAQADRSLLKELEEAIGMRVELAKFREQLDKGGFLGVHARPKYLQSGQVWVYGSVNNIEQAKKLKVLSTPFGRAAELEYSVGVVRKLAHDPKKGPSQLQ